VSAMPLPPEVAHLPILESEPWLQVGIDPMGILEGPAFDREGNLYLCFTGPRVSPHRILRIAHGTQEIATVYSSIPGELNPCGIAIHRDHRIFIAGLAGKITIINPEGGWLQDLDLTYGGESQPANDLVFDGSGNLYFTDFRGTLVEPKGGIYRMDASAGYGGSHKVLGGLAAPNGISFSPSGDTLWIGETGRNRIIRIDLAPDGLTPMPVDGITCPFQSTGGPGGPDSNKVDSEGNLYQCMVRQGRVIVLNRFGVPVANVVVPGREDGLALATTNLAFKPGTREAYLMTAGEGGPCVHRFSGLAPGLALYSHT